MMHPIRIDSSNGWRPIPLLATHLVAAVLLVSYQWPAGFAAWRSLDEQVFFLFNGTLSGTGPWELFWAWTNTRYCDAVTGMLIVLFLTHPISGFRSDRLQATAFLCLAMMLVMLANRNLFHQISDRLQLGGAGPSLVLTPVVRLSELFPNLPLKDASEHSFPGDHAAVLFSWVGFVLLGKHGWRSWPAAGIPLIMVLPRLFSGAHWLSDLLVGSLFVAIPVLGWTFYSPLVSYLANGLAWGASPILASVSRLPWFRNQQFFLYANK